VHVLEFFPRVVVFSRLYLVTSESIHKSANKVAIDAVMSRETMGNVLAKLRLQSPFQGAGIDWIVTFMSPKQAPAPVAGVPEIVVDDERLIILATPSVTNALPPDGWFDDIDVTGMSSEQKYAAWAARAAFPDLHSRFTETMPFENLKLLIEHNFPPGSRLTRTEIYYRSMITKATSHLPDYFRSGNFHFEDYFKRQMCVVGASIKMGGSAPTVERDYPKLMRNIALRLCQSHVKNHRLSPPDYVPMCSLEKIFNRGFVFSFQDDDEYEPDGLYFNLDFDKRAIQVNDPAYDHVDEFPLKLVSKALMKSIENRDYLKRGGRYVGGTVLGRGGGRPMSATQPGAESDWHPADPANALLLLAADGTTWAPPPEVIADGDNWSPDSLAGGDAQDADLPPAEGDVVNEERSTDSSFDMAGDDNEDMIVDGPEDDMEVEGPATNSEEEGMVTGSHVNFVMNSDVDSNSDLSTVQASYFDLPRNYLYWYGRGVCPVTGLFFSWRIRYLNEEDAVVLDEQEVVVVE
jgi:hypothetical protein